MTVIIVLLLVVAMDGAYGCTCPSIPYEDTVCNAQFVAKVKVLSQTTLADGREYYKVVTQKKSEYLYEGDFIKFAYRVIDPLSSCRGLIMEVGKSYLLTGFPYSPETRTIEYTTCQLTIEWSQYQTQPQYDSLRNFLDNYGPTSCS